MKNDIESAKRARRSRNILIGKMVLAIILSLFLVYLVKVQGWEAILGSLK